MAPFSFTSPLFRLILSLSLSLSLSLAEIFFLIDCNVLLDTERGNALFISAARAFVMWAGNLLLTFAKLNPLSSMWPSSFISKFEKLLTRRMKKPNSLHCQQKLDTRAAPNFISFLFIFKIMG
jgi:hypothetical protein